MTVSRLHTLEAARIDTDSGADLTLDQILGFSISPGVRELMARANGDVDPTFVAIGSQTPGMRFTSAALATALAAGAVTINGLKIDAGAGGPGLQAFFQAMDEGGTRKSGASHLKMTVTEGLLVPRQIRADHNRIASVEFALAVTYDGTNDPISFSDGESVTTSPAASQAYWTAGPVYLNGTELEGVQSIVIDYGIELVVQGGSGEVFPTFVAIQSRSPRIEVQTSDVVSLETLGISGAAQGGTSSKIYLRKIAANGTRVADATAEHILCEVADGIIVPAEASVDQDSVAGAGVRITPGFDNSNDIINFSLASAMAA